MKDIRFIPWVGTDYRQGINGQRIMALGESHYCAHPEEAVPNLTIQIIQDLLDPLSGHEGYKNTYTKFERALAGKALSAEEKQIWWNKVLFYNYVQTPISGARIAPTDAEFQSSEKAFFEVLAQYRPDRILVWGNRLYNHLPQKGFQLPDLVLPNGDAFETWGYELPDKQVVQLLPITHPSAAFVPVYWHEVIHTFINRNI